MNNIEKLQEMIDNSNYIVFFGGAGVSTESGIKDFRSVDGLYSMKYKYPPEYMLHIGMLLNNPLEFFKFYKENLNCLDAKPNVTHNYLKKLEDSGKLKAVITQNIDGLHTKAGSKKVYEIHGTIYRNYCTKCKKEFDEKYIFNANGIPYCDRCNSIVRPDVVLYGETLPDTFYDAIKEISKADMLIVAGSSLVVHPANNLVDMFKGKKLVIINKETTAYDDKATLVIHDNMKTVFDKLK